MSETQLAFSLAEEICELHDRITQATQDVFADAIALGGKLNEADDCPGFDFGALPFDERQCTRYRNVYARRDELSQAVMAEILSLPAPREKPDAVKGPELKWAKFTGPINTLNQWVRKRRAEMPVSDWPPIYRKMLRDRLKPLVELYEEIN